MRFLTTAAVCLISTAGLAQSPQPGQPLPGPIPMQGSAITQSSRVRAFNAGPDGQIHSVYLANGSVVDLSSSFAPGFNSLIHKGTRMRIVGSRTVVNGQSIIVPQQLTIGQQRFTVQPGPGPGGQEGMPAPPNGGPGIAPPPTDHDRARHAGMPPPPPMGPHGPALPPGPRAGAGGPGTPPSPRPAGPNGPEQLPKGRASIAPGQQPGNTPGNIAPPPPDSQQPAPGGSPQPPAPMDSTQPAPASPSAPNR